MHAFHFGFVLPISSLFQIDPEISYGNSRLYSKRMVSQWLKANDIFPIQGQSLAELIKEQTTCFTPLIWALGSRLGTCFNILVALGNFAVCMLTIVLMATKQLAPSAVEIGWFLGFQVVILLFLVSITLLRHFFSQAIHESKQLWDDWTHMVKPGKKLFVSDKGHLGTVGERAKVGDLIYFLVGCPEPVVLRKATRDGDAAGARAKYEVVGPCCIHLKETDLKEYLGSEEADEEAQRNWLQESERNGLLEEVDLV